MSYARSAVTRMTLDMSRLDLQRSETVTQGDTNRRWEVTLINGGAPFRLPPNWTAALTGIKPDGNGLLNGCSVVDGKIIYDFATGKEIATCVGSYPVQFDIWDEVGELVASPKVYVNVLADVRPKAELDSEGQYTLIGDAIKKITDMEKDVDLLADTALAQGDEITALKEKITTAGTITIPASEWTDTLPKLASPEQPVLVKGTVALLMPSNTASQIAARKAKITVQAEPYKSGNIIVQREDGEAPTENITLDYIIIKVDNPEAPPKAALIGVDAYGEGGGTASGVDEKAVKALIDKEVPEWARAKQKPTYTAEEVKARPATWTPTAEEIGARPSTWMPTAAEVGARPNTWTPTAKEVGADSAAAEIVQNHNEDGESHVDIRLDITTIRNMLAGVIGTDTGKSMRAVAALVLAEIVGDASDSFDTLEEIAAWIEAHPNDVAAIVKRITDLEAAMGGKVSKTDIINTLDSTALDKPLSAAMGKQLAGAISQINETLAVKTTAEQVAAQIKAALTDYLTKEKAAELYQPKGDYLTTADAPAIINTEVNKVVSERKEEMRGEPGQNGKTPEAGVDYPTVEQVDSYIAAELAKRNQFVPIPAASVEGMTDTTKIYYLTTTGELYAYAPTQVVVGGYTNLADPTAEGWQSPARINESGAITTGSATGSFVTPIYPAKAGQKIYIKGVKELDNSMRRFRVATYDASGSILYPTAYKLIGGGDLSHVGPVVTVSDDGVYCWEIGQLKTGAMHDTASRIAGVRVTGGAIDGEDNVIITLDEPIVEPTIETVYKWAGTGHFISSEEAITALESRVNMLEDEVEELTVTVDRLKTNSSISMQSGAVWYALGDSITQGYASRVNASATNGYDQYVAAEGKRWVDYVAALNGYKLTNKGEGGTGYQHSAKNARAQVDGIDFSECDLVTLAYGINDFKNPGTNIGSMDDDIQTGGSFVSNMRYCIKKILADNPLCKIIVITPLNYRGLGTYATNYSIGYTGSNASCANLDYMVDLMEQVCKYHGIEMIDMTHSSIVNRENIVAMLPDYVHPSEECHRVMGYELARKINFA